MTLEVKMQGVLGEKVGMTAIFEEDGRQIPVTVVRTAGNIVVEKRTEARDGYNAVVLGFGERRVKRVTDPEMGLFKKHNLVQTREDGREVVKRHLREIRLSAEELNALEIGQEIRIEDLFTTGQRVDVTGRSKGRGFSGVMKRHNYHGAKATHGVHEYFRHGGAISSCTYPARVFKNKKMPGQYGNARTTLLNLSLAKIFPEEQLLLIKGNVPGPNGGLLLVRKAVKTRH